MQLLKGSTQRVLVAPTLSRRTHLRTVATSQRSTTLVDDPVSRRAVGAALLLPAILLASPSLPAHAGLNKDPRAYIKEREARKAKLKAAAELMKNKGKTADAFDDSKYSLPEESRTPNMRSLANDRLRENE
jgi:hypothetical protein